MGTGIVILIIVAVLALVAAVLVVSVYNSLVTTKNRIEEALSTIEAYLKRRYDLIPNLVETVKGYATHEKKTFTKVIEARNKVMSAVGFEEMSRSENALKETLKSLFALAEAYPELKANENFMELQRELTKTEDDILQSRKYYNAVVKRFNTKIEVFPNSLIASLFRFEKREYYRIEEEAGENVKVTF